MHNAFSYNATFPTCALSNGRDVARKKYFYRYDCRICFLCKLYLLKKLKKQGHRYRLFPVENRGRDVLPFLKIMPEVVSGNHEFFVKIHTKKTTHRIDGDRWRTDLFDQLISEEAIKISTDFLKNNSDVGILGRRGS